MNARLDKDEIKAELDLPCLAIFLSVWMLFLRNIAAKFLSPFTRIHTVNTVSLPTSIH